MNAHAQTSVTDPRVAAEVARCGSLDAAISQLAHDACGAEWGSAVHDIYRAALVERSAQRQSTETLDERAFRLGLMAADKDAEAERHLVAAADAAGLAAGRRLKGWDDEAARSADREELNCTGLAVLCMAEAERLRSQARAIRRTQNAKAYAAGYLAILQGA